jgi:hypothetical protein
MRARVVAANTALPLPRAAQRLSAALARADERGRAVRLNVPGLV